MEYVDLPERPKRGTFATAAMWLIALFAVAVLASELITSSKRHQLIEAHQIKLTMSSADVLASLGTPVSRRVIAPAGELWTYADGRTVTFGHDQVIDSTPPVSQRTASYIPGIGYIEHDSHTSAMQSIGGGGGGTGGTSSSQKRPGTMLDQPAHR